MTIIHLYEKAFKFVRLWICYIYFLYLAFQVSYIVPASRQLKFFKFLSNLFSFVEVTGYKYSTNAHYRISKGYLLFNCAQLNTEESIWSNNVVFGYRKVIRHYKCFLARDNHPHRTFVRGQPMNNHLIFPELMPSRPNLKYQYVNRFPRFWRQHKLTGNIIYCRVISVAVIGIMQSPLWYIQMFI